MKINKKTIEITAMTALVSATAAASVFVAGAAGTTTTGFMTKAFGNRSNHTETEAERTEHQKAMATSLATALGATPDAIVAQLTAGKSPRDIIKASGLDEATVKAQLDASRDADMRVRLASDVASGKFTQAQADQRLTDMKNHTGGRGFGGERGFNKK